MSWANGFQQGLQKAYALSGNDYGFIEASFRGIEKVLGLNAKGLELLPQSQIPLQLVTDLRNLQYDFQSIIDDPMAWGIDDQAKATATLLTRYSGDVESVGISPTSSLYAAGVRDHKIPATAWSFRAGSLLEQASMVAGVADQAKLAEAWQQVSDASAEAAASIGVAVSKVTNPMGGAIDEALKAAKGFGKTLVWVGAGLLGVYLLTTRNGRGGYD